MVKDYLRDLIEFLRPGRIPLLFHPYQPLYLKLHRGKGILDLMSHLPCHAAPGLVALSYRQFLRGVGQVMHHEVICPYESRNLVITVIYDILEMSYFRRIHLASHLGQRTEHPGHHKADTKAGKQQQDDEQHDHRSRVEDGLGPQVETLVGIRGAYYRQYSSGGIHHRSIQGLAGTVAKPVGTDIIALVKAHYIGICLVIDAERKDPPVEKLGGRGTESHSSGSVQGNVRRVDVAYQVKECRDLLGIHFLD